MTEQRVIFGQRGGKSFQAGYDAGYAACKQDIANEPPGTEEVKWLRKLKYAILRGEVDIHINVNFTANQSALETYAQRQVIEYAEAQEARYIKHLQDTIDRLKTSPRWTPCAERLPTEDGIYMVTIRIDNILQHGEYESRVRLDDGHWLGMSSDMKVTAWRKESPYNPDHIVYAGKGER